MEIVKGVLYTHTHTHRTRFLLKEILLQETLYIISERYPL